MSSTSHHLLSGALSGLTSVLCLQPFDLLKTRIQQSDPLIQHQRRQHQQSIHSLVKQIIRNDGLLGLWRGTTPTLLRNVPGVALYFSTLQHVRSILSSYPSFRLPISASASSSSSSSSSTSTSTLPTLTNTGNLLAGSTTRVFIGIVLNPLSVVKARFESSLPPYLESPTTTLGGKPHPPSLLSSLRALARSPPDLLRGAGASALRDAPYAALFLVAYERLKRFGFDTTQESFAFTLPPAIIHSLSAATAGTFATFITHPFDVLKTKIQVRPEARYRSIQSAASAVWRSQGWIGFFDGVSLRLTRKILSSAVGWAVYEGILLVMR